MKNLINYYYNLIIDDFKKVNDNFVFMVTNKNYEFTYFDGDINNFYKNYSIVKRYNKYCHEVVFNKDKQIITFYNNKPYILLQKNICIDKNVDLNEIINYNKPVYNINDFNWKKFWKNKIDYYEYQMSQLAVKFIKLNNSFSYYIGLSETAISLLNYIEKSDIRYFINHKRINLNEKLDDFFNPINFVIDSRVRDIAEYIKISYFYEKIDEIEIFKSLDYLKLNNTECILFIARLLYPSYYFDMYDQIIQEKISEDKICLITEKNTSYEAFLRKIYKHISKKYKIPLIDWLNN